MTTEALHDGDRRLYALETAEPLHPRDGRLVSDVVLDVLGPLLDRAELDAYTDYPEDRGEAERRAEDTLRAVKASAAGRRGDPGMVVALRLTGAEAAEVAGRVAALGELRLLRDLDRERRAARRARWRAAWSRWWRRSTG